MLTWISRSRGRTAIWQSIKWVSCKHNFLTEPLTLVFFWASELCWNAIHRRYLTSAFDENLCKASRGTESAHCSSYEFALVSFHGEKVRLMNLSHLRRSRGVTRGTQFPGRRITMGAPKSSNSVASTFFNSTFASEWPPVRTWGRQTCVLPWAPSNFVTPLRGWIVRLMLPCWWNE